MAHINLLPWREELRLKRQNEFVAMLGGTAAFMLLVMFGVHSQFGAQIDYQSKRNGYLKKEIASVDLKIKEIKDIEKKKTGLIARMEVIQKLQGSRPQIVHTFFELASAIPEGVYIYDLKQKGATLTIKGMAQSNARVSSFMRNLDASDWLGGPNLDSIHIKKKGSDKSADFKLNVDQVDKNKPKKKDGGK